MLLGTAEFISSPVRTLLPTLSSHFHLRGARFTKSCPRIPSLLMTNLNLTKFFRLLTINPLRLRNKIMEFVFKNCNNISEYKQLSLIAKRSHFGSRLWNRLFSPVIQNIPEDLSLAGHVSARSITHTFFCRQD